eukprot:14699544-Alexandrium_andersonii.AAC.1
MCIRDSLCCLGTLDLCAPDGARERVHWSCTAKAWSFMTRQRLRHARKGARHRGRWRNREQPSRNGSMQMGGASRGAR